ncbi:MAG: D-alanyl-D-alanine carboxypeptidase/D-alanyl-D-alanine-endopeptidase [Bacteroidetes bacterium SB0662_bin_6]|nr:D-alanyl-D-alanine carboxypeptidase/D-alanyl-D-alanine-endopeptidase [Bacteroidetes bacterium SB0668_bin_1]MYE03581.1 D-alanyl-D-alanine carboxypeptidase/D-alanyl-D-alanine-endopeptidase [Bacteroidetes bacterium SB0662_bin_6]
MGAKRLITLLFLCSAASCVTAVYAQESEGIRRLRNPIDHLLDAEPFENGFWGVHIVDIESGRVLYARNAGKSFVPASNTKLYTTAAALDLLGPDYRFETGLYTDGMVDEEGVLHGNVIVRGGADPTLGGHYLSDSGDWDEDIDALVVFRNWADSLRAAGIRRITGDLIGDDDVIDDVPLGVNWSWDDETWYYSAQLGGLAFHDNVIHLYVDGRTPGMPANLTWEPLNTDYVQVINRTLTTEPGTGLKEGYQRQRGTNTIEVTTRVPAGASELEEITVENPTRYTVYVLRETLLQSGIAVTGDPVDVDALSIKPAYETPSYRRVAIHRSAPLPEIASLINKPSQNLYADLLMKMLGAALPQEDNDLDPGSAAMGIETAMSTFARAGVDTSAIRLVDGSGLSRLNLVAPEMTTALLSFMWTHPDTRVRDAFYDSLPVAGQSGSLKHRMRRGLATENMRGKTGTLTFASSLSGYVRAHDGRMLAFSIMSNHHISGSTGIRRIQDAIVELLAGFE